MTLAAIFAAVDLLVGLYLLWYGVTRQRQRKEAVLLVGTVLVLSAMTLAVLTWHATHRETPVDHRQDRTATPV